MKNKILLSLIACSLTLACLPSSAAAAPDGHASCVGVLAVAFSADGLADEIAMVKELTDLAGVPFGVGLQVLTRETGDVEYCLSLLGF